MSHTPITFQGDAAATGAGTVTTATGTDVYTVPAGKIALGFRIWVRATDDTQTLGVDFTPSGGSEVGIARFAADTNGVLVTDIPYMAAGDSVDAICTDASDAVYAYSVLERIAS